jgi:hypothetical protein
MPPWLEQHNLPSSPPWIDGPSQSVAPQAKMVASSPPKPAKRGPKFRYDWEEGRQFFAVLMAKNGDLDERPEWCAQADIEREVMAHMKRYGGGEPASSLVQEHVKQWLTDFRAANTQ